MFSYLGQRNGSLAVQNSCFCLQLCDKWRARPFIPVDLLAATDLECTRSEGGVEVESISSCFGNGE